VKIKKHLLLTFALALFLSGEARAQMKAHFINVGQADSILLEFKSAAILIDAGGEDTGNSRDRDHLVGFLNEFFTRRTDLNRTIHSLIVSHPHKDHTLNIMAVLQNFKVKNLMDGGGETGSGIDENRQARAFAEANNIIYNRIPDNRIGRNGYTTPLLRALARTPSQVDLRFLAGFRGCRNENNDTLALLVRYKSTTMLFSGDAQDTGETGCQAEIKHMLQRYRGTSRLNVDLYKVGHHGSHNGSSVDFLRAMSPKISVLSAGSKDTRSPGGFHAFQFGHPRENIVKMLEDATTMRRPSPVTVYTMTGQEQILDNRRVEKAVYCTCWDGDIVVTVNTAGTTLTVEAGNP